MLDDYGMYMTYGEAVNVEEMSAGRYLPEGLVEGCRLTRDMPKDAVITYDDVVLPAGRLADRLRARAVPSNFAAKPGSTTYWLPRSLPIGQPICSCRKSRTIGVIGQQFFRINDLIALSWSSESWSRLLSGRPNANFEKNLGGLR